jgi:hypothetical protein
VALVVSNNQPLAAKVSSSNSSGIHPHQIVPTDSLLVFNPEVLE